jgi:hypothetical protein
MAKLSQRRASKKQKVLQRSNPFVSETFVSFGPLAGAPALETDVYLSEDLYRIWCQRRVETVMFQPSS